MILFILKPFRSIKIASTSNLWVLNACRSLEIAFIVDLLLQKPCFIMKMPLVGIFWFSNLVVRKLRPLRIFLFKTDHSMEIASVVDHLVQKPYYTVEIPSIVDHLV